MPNVEFNFKQDFENIIQQGITPAQVQLLKELFEKYNVNEDEIFYIMHKKPEAIKFKKGDHVLYLGYAHLRPSQMEFEVNEVVNIHLDCLTDVSIRRLSGGESYRVYHRDLVKIDK